MRKLVMTIIAASASLQFALAGFTVPRSVYTMDQLEEAKAEAAENEKPLMFVYTDPAST